MLSARTDLPPHTPQMCSLLHAELLARGMSYRVVTLGSSTLRDVRVGCIGLFD